MESMTSMKRTPDDKRAGCGCCAPIEALAPDYPWGLCIHLQTDELEKLGIDPLPAVGMEVMLHCKAKVTRVNQSAVEGSREDREVGLQITDLQIMHGGEK